MENKKRVAAVIVENNKILLIHRIKSEIEYFTLPGGTVEEGEELEDAMRREAKEELSIDVEIDRLLFEIESENRKDWYYLIKKGVNSPKIGGPEAIRMNNNNQYHLEWISRGEFANMSNFHPATKGADKNKIISLWEEGKL